MSATGFDSLARRRQIRGREARVVRALLNRLERAPMTRFPKRGERICAPDKHGVYVVYSPRARRVVHVGRTYRGAVGLRRRLKNHLHRQSSFTSEYLKGNGDKLRHGYTFRCLPVAAPRIRALLENYATGSLCPVHLGTNE